MNQLDKDVNQLIANSKAKKKRTIEEAVQSTNNPPVSGYQKKIARLKFTWKSAITSSIVISISVATIIRSKSVR